MISLTADQLNTVKSHRVQRAAGSVAHISFPSNHPRKLVDTDDLHLGVVSHLHPASLQEMYDMVSAALDDFHKGIEKGFVDVNVDLEKVVANF